MAANMNPTLTTVAQDKYLLGRVGARSLMHEIAAGSGLVLQKAFLQPQLIVRQSTGRPNSQPAELAPASQATHGEQSTITTVSRERPAGHIAE